MCNRGTLEKLPLPAAVDDSLFRLPWLSSPADVFLIAISLSLNSG
jgi:hypothetical protein